METKEERSDTERWEGTNRERKKDAYPWRTLHRWRHREYYILSRIKLQDASGRPRGIENATILAFPYWTIIYKLHVFEVVGLVSSIVIRLSCEKVQASLINFYRTNWMLWVWCENINANKMNQWLKRLQL